MNMKKILTLSLFSLMLGVSSQSFATMLFHNSGSHIFGGSENDIRSYNIIVTILNANSIHHPSKKKPHSGGKHEGKHSNDDGDNNPPLPEEETPPISYNDGDMFNDHENDKLPPYCDNHDKHESVPEPSTIFMLGLGLIAVFFVSRSKAIKGRMSV